MDLTLTFANNKKIACEWAEHTQITNAVHRNGDQVESAPGARPGIAFTLPFDAIGVTALQTLINNPDNLRTIVIQNNELVPIVDDQGEPTGQSYHPTETVEYYILQSETPIQTKYVVVSEETPTEPAVTEQKYILTLGQITRQEKRMIDAGIDPWG